MQSRGFPPGGLTRGDGDQRQKQRLGPVFKRGRAHLGEAVEDATPLKTMSIAADSASKTEYQLLLALDLGTFAPAAHQNLHSRATEVRRMLSGFMQRLTANS